MRDWMRTPVLLVLLMTSGCPLTACRQRPSSELAPPCPASANSEFAQRYPEPIISRSPSPIPDVSLWRVSSPNDAVSSRHPVPSLWLALPDGRLFELDATGILGVLCHMSWFPSNQAEAVRLATFETVERGYTILQDGSALPDSIPTEVRQKIHGPRAVGTAGTYQVEFHSRRKLESYGGVCPEDHASADGCRASNVLLQHIVKMQANPRIFRESMEELYY